MIHVLKSPLKPPLKKSPPLLYGMHSAKQYTISGNQPDLALKSGASIHFWDTALNSIPTKVQYTP